MTNEARVFSGCCEVVEQMGHGSLMVAIGGPLEDVNQMRKMFLMAAISRPCKVV